MRTWDAVRRLPEPWARKGSCETQGLGRSVASPNLCLQLCAGLGVPVPLRRRGGLWR